MKIAFASCFDAVDDSQQTVWDRIRDQAPSALLLLGDSVYMDFGLLGDRHLGWPRKASLDEFAQTLHSRYQLQWAVPAFRRLVTSGLTIGATWDDHDFAWNDSRGAGTEKKYAVSSEQRRISKSLFLQFLNTMRTLRTPDYPPMPSLDELLNTSDTGIEEAFDLGSVRIVMLDGRTYRQDENDTPDAEMHGREQRRWLKQQLDSWPGLKIVCSGSVLTHSKESWDGYADYQWLLQEAPSRVIVLTGDIHKNVPPNRHRENPPLYEIISSGAARPGLGGNTGNFGILQIEESVSVTLHSKEIPNGKNYGLVF